MRLLSNNKKRLQEIIQKGDKVSATVFYGHRQGFACIAEVRAVHHWGVFAILKGEDLNYYCRNRNQEFKDKINKRQFKIKWKHINNIEPM